MSDGAQLLGGAINVEQLQAEMDSARVDAVVAAAPDNTYYLAGTLIRTQVSIPERLAIVVWPRHGDPVFIVCDIEEGQARRESWIPEVVVYTEFAETPIAALATVLRDRGLERGRLGIEERFLTVAYHRELLALTGATVVAADDLLQRVRSIKTPLEIERLTAAFLRTEEAIRAAWAASKEGDSERLVAERMTEQVRARGADGIRHITLAAGANTVYAHRRPSPYRLARGDLLLTDFGAEWDGFCSDIARMGAVGEPGQVLRDEYRRFRDAQLSTLHHLRPGLTGADVYRHCREAFRQRGLTLQAPHVGHGVSRRGGHESPMLHERNSEVLRPDMLIAVEPILRGGRDRRYHLEDLVLITENGSSILTPWETTKEMIAVGQ
jgi:Xaa-Pro aminopeptidase